MNRGGLKLMRTAVLCLIAVVCSLTIGKTATA